jgi:hypothetical protein
VVLVNCGDTTTCAFSIPFVVELVCRMSDEKIWVRIQAFLKNFTRTRKIGWL